MKTVYSPNHGRHYPQIFLSSGRIRNSPEIPERAEILHAAALATGSEIIVPRDYGLGAAASIHTPAYIHFLRHIHARWTELPDASDEVIPNVHPISRSDRYPDSAVGQAGFHLGDTACPVGSGTWEAALAATHCASTAADLILDGEANAYALCRPPGHHASVDMASGFCFFNNSAIAAQRLRQSHARVAIIDIDLHHGNGTQHIFYRRADVFTASLHADPASFYPFFWGHACERGEAEGLGYNANLPLPHKSGDDEFLAGLEVLLHQIGAFDPGAVVVALGLDASEQDPFGGLNLSTEGFARVGAALAAMGQPTVLVQEGGYICDALGSNLQAVLEAF